MTPQIDPDAPWWANIVVLLVVLAVVPALTTWATQRGTRRRVTETQESVGRVLDQVANTHTTNLRDDLDEKIAGVVASQEAMRKDIGGLHSEMRDARRDIAGIRTDGRQDRRALAEQRDALAEHLADVPRLVAEAVRRAEADHVHTCPLRQRLLTPDPDDPED